MGHGMAGFGVLAECRPRLKFLKAVLDMGMRRYAYEWSRCTSTIVQ